MKQLCFPIVAFLALSVALYGQTASNPLSADIKQAYESVEKNLNESGG